MQDIDYRNCWCIQDVIMQDIDDKNCWCMRDIIKRQSCLSDAYKNGWVTQDVIKRQSCFFDALKQFSGGGLRLYIEAYTIPAGRKALAPMTLDANMILGIGATSPPPNEVLHFDMTDVVLDTLSSLVADKSVYVEHLAVYRDCEILLAYSDAFMKNSIVNVSKSLDSQEVNRFCDVLGVSLQDSHDVYPELHEE